MRFLKKRFQPHKQPIIIVSGLPRSGTSMMMKMLEAGGILPLTDKIRTADEDNPKGYYEFERVKKLDRGDTEWLADAQGKSVKVISQLLRHLPDNYTYKIIFMRRDMGEILISQKKMLLNRGQDPHQISDEELTALFEKHLANVTNWLDSQANIDLLYIHYKAILANPQPEAELVNSFLDNKLNVEAITAVVDPTLYRNRIK